MISYLPQRPIGRTDAVSATVRVNSLRLDVRPFFHRCDWDILQQHQSLRTHLSLPPENAAKLTIPAVHKSTRRPSQLRHQCQLYYTVFLPYQARQWSWHLLWLESAARCRPYVRKSLSDTKSYNDINVLLLPFCIRTLRHGNGTSADMPS